MFVDRVEIELYAGKGGDGCLSFRRLRYVPKGGPDGGDGGNGGSIVMEAREGVDSLAVLAQRRMWKAKRGQHGRGSNKNGRRGEDLLIEVPPGTVVVDRDQEFVIKDLSSAGEKFIIARGGKGGRGNTHFKSATNRAPREYTRGEDGESRRVVLELKMIADVGLIGMPNAGKSTLLSRLSQARPEIASYPFTTKRPILGLVQVDLDRSFVMADIPGLIEGAHAGVGLGHEFLRHVERSGVLIHLVEPMPMDETNPCENYQAIRAELLQYNPKLGERPEIVAVTKCELPGSEEVRDRLADLADRYVHLVSAVTGQGLNQLTADIVQHLSERALR
jgi:GTP-binding protein